LRRFPTELSNVQDEQIFCMYFTNVLLYFHYCLEYLSTTHTFIYFTCVEVNFKIF
jgi:hypothetical protein